MQPRIINSSCVTNSNMTEMYVKTLLAEQDSTAVSLHQADRADKYGHKSKT